MVLRLVWPVLLAVAGEYVLAQPSMFLRRPLRNAVALPCEPNRATIVSIPNSVGTGASGTTYVWNLYLVAMAFFGSSFSQPVPVRVPLATLTQGLSMEPSTGRSIGAMNPAVSAVGSRLGVAVGVLSQLVPVWAQIRF